MTLFQPLVLTRLGSLHYSSCSYWLLINSARILQRRNLRASTVFSFSRDRMSVTVCPTDESLFFRLCQTGKDAHLRTVSDIMWYSIACRFSQNCSGLLKLSRWHLQTLRPIVSSPDRCVSTRILRFSRASVFLYRQYLVQTFRWDETLRSTTEYTDKCLSIYRTCLVPDN